jgi:hypothetical protein
MKSWHPAWPLRVSCSTWRKIGLWCQLTSFYYKVFPCTNSTLNAWHSRILGCNYIPFLLLAEKPFVGDRKTICIRLISSAPCWLDAAWLRKWITWVGTCLAITFCNLLTTVHLALVCAQSAPSMSPKAMHPKCVSAAVLALLSCASIDAFCREAREKQGSWNMLQPRFAMVKNLAVVSVACKGCWLNT